VLALELALGSVPRIKALPCFRLLVVVELPAMSSFLSCSSKSLVDRSSLVLSQSASGSESSSSNVAVGASATSSVFLLPGASAASSAPKTSSGSITNSFGLDISARHLASTTCPHLNAYTRSSSFLIPSLTLNGT